MKSTNDERKNQMEDINWRKMVAALAGSIHEVFPRAADVPMGGVGMHTIFHSARGDYYLILEFKTHSP